MEPSKSKNGANDNPSFRERRSSESEWTFGTAKVAHAINYLLTEQMAGRRYSVDDNREAVSLLCRAFEKLAAHERRAPELKSFLAFLFPFQRQKPL